jgi:hypothetical protein
MPSRIPAGYDTTSNGAGTTRTPYSWAPPSQASQPGTQPSTVSYYGYAVAPSGHLAYPTAAAAASSSAQSPKQEFTKKSTQAEERQGSSKHANGKKQEAILLQKHDREGFSSSPPSRTNSLESTGSKQDQSTTSPPKYATAVAYTQAVPFVAGRPTLPHGYQYGWAFPSNPYTRQYSAHLNNNHRATLDSAKTAADQKKSLLQQAASTNRTKPRATSPTQIESSRRDEVANMGCTCKKSKCLKLYCMCFGASVVCGPNCRCLVCFNTKDHEAERKEAVRVILSRNPSAFDTKFKKNAEKAETAATERVLTHKVGCKCRKSQCTKKYCECFNAGIKCSATCRCTGCQNMPPGGFGPDPRYPYPVHHPHQAYPTAIMPVRPNYVVEEHTSVAAQNLAFLKHSSPNKASDTTQSTGGPSGDSRKIASMSSIVSSDATPTPDTGTSPQASAKTELSDTDGANVLLMAAYAMTELNSAESPGKTATSDGPGFRPSPKRKTTDFASEEGSSMDGYDSGAYDSPPKSFPDFSVQKDASPETAAEMSPLVTPAPQRKAKRSRVGTHKRSAGSKKKDATNGSIRDKNAVDSDDEPENKSPASTKTESTVEEEEEEPNDASTPRTRSRTKAQKEVLTPVSARAIDFRRMNVKGKKQDEESDEQMDDVGAS